ncbi:MAG: helix-turn-helix domain-containing protein [Microthrixaceae bacterium]
MTTLQQQARALGDPTRHAIFSSIAELGRPMGVSELTQRFALNHNAIRQHLARLVSAGLVVERKAPASGRGRPPFEYVVDPVAEGRWGSNGPYEQLSGLLAEVITTGLSPGEVGRRAGERMRVPVPSGDAVADIGAAMARQGFDPEVREVEGGADMILHRCPFASTAVDAREAVCSLHLGLAEGLLGGVDGESGGGGMRIAELVAQEPERAECCLRIRELPPDGVPADARAMLTFRGGSPSSGRT